MRKAHDESVLPEACDEAAIEEIVLGAMLRRLHAA
jgi:hypothetical protein